MTESSSCVAMFFRNKTSFIPITALKVAMWKSASVQEIVKSLTYADSHSCHFFLVSPPPPLPVTVNKWNLCACGLIVTWSLNSYVKMSLRPSHASQALRWTVLHLGSGLGRAHFAQGRATSENQHRSMPPVTLTSELCSFRRKHIRT